MWGHSDLIRSFSGDLCLGALASTHVKKDLPLVAPCGPALHPKAALLFRKQDPLDVWWGLGCFLMAGLELSNFRKSLRNSVEQEGSAGASWGHRQGWCRGMAAALGRRFTCEHVCATSILACMFCWQARLLRGSTGLWVVVATLPQP